MYLKTQWRERARVTVLVPMQCTTAVRIDQEQVCVLFSLKISREEMKFSSDQIPNKNQYQVRINWSEMNFIRSHSSFSEMIPSYYRHYLSYNKLIHCNICDYYSTQNP